MLLFAFFSPGRSANACPVFAVSEVKIMPEALTHPAGKSESAVLRFCSKVLRTSAIVHSRVKFFILASKSQDLVAYVLFGYTFFVISAESEPVGVILEGKLKKKTGF